MIVLVALGAMPQRKAAVSKHCTDEQAIQADKEVDSLYDWDRVYGSFRKFSQCDDGAIAEGYSDSVTKLLANKWSAFGRLLTLARTDKSFQKFVLRHINETVPDTILAKIASNARSECPSGAQTLCRLIARAAKKE